MRVGIDIGGSHIGIGLFNDDGDMVKIYEKYIKDKGELSAQDFITREIITCLNTWKNEEGIAISSIGIGAPGIIREDMIVSSVNLGIENFKIKDELAIEFPEAEIKVLNDAKCAALAEKHQGSLKGFDDCIFLCLGTGIGGAAFLGGKLLKPNRCAGFEVGHMIIEKSGRPCKCGSNGCYEQYGSMRCFKRTIKERLGLTEEVDGADLRDIIRLRINDDIVRKTIDEYAEYVCLELTNLVNILEPQAICLGGGFVKYRDILADVIVEKFNNSKDLFYKENKPKIVLAELENDAGMIGAALYI